MPVKFPVVEMLSFFPLQFFVNDEYKLALFVCPFFLCFPSLLCIQIAFFVFPFFLRFFFVVVFFFFFFFTVFVIMEIIDRPLSEVIKEKKIGQELRRFRGPSQRSGNSTQGKGNRTNNRSSGGDQQKSNNRSRRGGNNDNRRNDLPSRRNPSQRFRRFRDDRRRGRFVDDVRRRGGAPPLPYRRGIEGTRRSIRRGGVDYGDSRRPVGVKSFGVSRRLGVSGSDRNERLRRRERESALDRSRRSRR